MRMRKLGALECPNRLWDPELRFDLRPSAGKGREHPSHRGAHDLGVTLFDTARFTVPGPTKRWSGKRWRPSATRS